MAPMRQRAATSTNDILPVKTWKFWVLATRPKTLPAAAAPVIIGSALAAGDGQFTWLTGGATLLAALLLQIGVNLANDYFDGIRGIDTAERLGPLRVTQTGLISPAKLIGAIATTFLMAAMIGIYLSSIGGWPIVVTGMVCIMAALTYSGGPYPAASHGLGDILALVFFGWVAVCGTYYLHTHQLTFMALLAGTQIGMLITSILVVNNLRDIETDRKTGKITLAVRIGARGSKMEYILLISGAYIPLPFLWLTGQQTPWILLPLLSLPLAISLQTKVWNCSAGPVMNRLLAGTAGLSLLYSILLAAGLVF